jgi:hypothetical protein
VKRREFITLLGGCLAARGTEPLIHRTAARIIMA